MSCILNVRSLGKFISIRKTSGRTIYLAQTNGEQWRSWYAHHYFQEGKWHPQKFTDFLRAHLWPTYIT